MVFTKTWDEDAPAGSDAALNGDNEIRDFKFAIRERLSEDHNFFADESGETNVGLHKKVSLLEVASDPASLADAMILYSKLADSFADLHLRHENAGVQRITRLGKLWIEALGIASEAQGDILINNGSKWTRLAVGANGKVLKSDGTDPSWDDPTTFASAAEVKTGTEAAKSVAPDTMVSHEGISKGWVNFTGTGTPTIQDSFNVDTGAGITDNGTGDYTVPWLTDFGSVNYVVQVNVVGDTGNVNQHGIVKFGGMATGSTTILTGSTAANNPVDVSVVMVTAIGDR